MDSTPPQILTDEEHKPYYEYVKEEGDAEDAEGHLHIFLSVSDNISVVDIYLENEKTGASVSEFNPIILDGYTYDPIFTATEPNEVRKVEFDGYHEIYLNEYVNRVFDNGKTADLEPCTYIISVVDAAGNEALYRIFADIEAVNEPTGVTITDAAGEAIEGTVTVAKGMTFQLSGVAEPFNLSDRSVVWSSEDETVATVDKNGVVTAVGTGTTNIVAAAKADETVTAKVEFEVITISVDLNALVWDSNGDIWWSTFNTADLPNYTGLVETPISGETGPYFDAAAYGADGKLYAATYGGSSSDFYVVDPDNGFEATKIGDGGLFTYTDLAPTFSLGDNLMLGTFGPYLALIDTTTGGSAIGPTTVLYANQLQANFVGVTYCGSMEYPATGAMVDLYYLMDDTGTVYVIGFSDIYSDGDIYSLRLTNDQYFRLLTTGISTDSESFNSLYFDEESGYTFWSRYSEREDDVDIIAIDLEETGNIFTLGSFEKGVWPVSGLFQLAAKEEAGQHSDAAAVVEAVKAGIEVDFETLPAAEDSTNAAGGNAGALNSIDAGEKTTAAAEAGVTVDEYTKTVTIPVYADSTNGKFTLTYDATVLELDSVTANSGILTSISTFVTPNTESGEDGETVTSETGTVLVGFADREAVDGSVVTVVLRYAQRGETTLTLTVAEDGSDTAGAETTYPVTLKMPPFTPPFIPSVPSEPTDPGTSEPAKPAHHFLDVPSNEWYADSVERLYQAGIIKGYSSEIFGPLDPMDRGMTAALLYRIAGKPASDATGWFSDVPASHTFADAIDWAASMGYVNGFGGGIFRPNEVITREQLAVILWRYAKVNGYDVSANGFVMPEFRDLDLVSDWAKEAMCWAVRTGIIRGDGVGLIPQGVTDRATAATILCRFMDLLEREETTSPS